MPVPQICKVLIVEDNPDIRELLGDIFGYEGYRFVMARDGTDMRRAIAEERDIDIVVIDVTLPGTANGFVLAIEAKNCGCGVILVTGDHRHYEEVEKSGHRYIFKPFRMASLITLVDHVLAETKRHCERPSARPNHQTKVI